jgi:hypothetical protein
VFDVREEVVVKGAEHEREGEASVVEDGAVTE